jgi:nucleolar protein 6
MSAQQKLTKKQKKSLAFRERKGKPKALPDEEDRDVPIDENQDLRAEMDDFEMEVDKDGDRGKAQIHMADETERGGPVKDSAERGPGARKRKREQAEDLDEVEKHPRKKKADKITTELVEKDGSIGTSSLTKKTLQRFILFIGEVEFTSDFSVTSHVY